MDAKLSAAIDTDPEVFDANILSHDEGICLGKLCDSFEKDTSIIVFHKRLAYGSWYDVLICINR
jgi:hypothetical protein